MTNNLCALPEKISMSHYQVLQQPNLGVGKFEWLIRVNIHADAIKAIFSPLFSSLTSMSSLIIWLDLGMLQQNLKLLPALFSYLFFVKSVQYIWCVPHNKTITHLCPWSQACRQWLFQHLTENSWWHSRLCLQRHCIVPISEETNTQWPYKSVPTLR